MNYQTKIAGFQCERVDQIVSQFENTGFAKGNGSVVHQYRRFLVLQHATYKFGSEYEAISAFKYMTGTGV